MSDRMHPMPFPVLLENIIAEYTASGTAFGVRAGFRGGEEHRFPLFGGQMEAPVGPAAGPHTQLAQNIVAAYVAGARFFELKTVQTLDGEDLPVSKPCILAEDEGYNVEWSTELTVPQAMDEYIKAWFALKLLAREFGLGSPYGFLFNMSVGYDFDGISSPKIDAFLEGSRDASGTGVWLECRAAARAFLPRLHNVDAAYLDAISPHVSSSVTLSTLHGCPPAEIERIAMYLLREKGLHTFVKCNPTLLGYETARHLLDGMGYTDLTFDDHHFKADLQWADALPMLTRLQETAAAAGLTFGVKLTNTFPVDITRGELPGDEMYLSGRALAPLSLALTERIADAFGGRLRISYSGGMDAFYIGALAEAGVWPITVATTLLKPGGYLRLNQLAKRTAVSARAPFEGVDAAKVGALRARVAADPMFRRPVKPVRRAKLSEKVPLFDCFTAPCTHGCPFGQDIPAYLRLFGEGRAREALEVILDKNPLPNITGTICPHRCTTKCTRLFYDEAVGIRSAKLAATEAAWDDILERIDPDEPVDGVNVAVVGGGPAGMAAAFFLARQGADVTLFESSDSLGGLVRHVIPEFRIPTEAIVKDATLLDLIGVDVRLNSTVAAAPLLLRAGFSHVVVAVGATARAEGQFEGSVDALDFLARVKAGQRADFEGAQHVVVIGGGNSAMDAARAARRLPNSPAVTVVYRRTAAQMPADEEELELARADGVILRELLTPVSWREGSLTCMVMELGAPDASGRGTPIATGETVRLPADLIISATGARVDGASLTHHGATMDFTGAPIVNSETLESGTRNIFVAGDARRGPATVAEAIADARTIADAILGEHAARARPAGRRGSAISRKGILSPSGSPIDECERCLQCATVCENCVDVCPNRANLSITLPTRRQTQILHLDALCNECGNCVAFCPYDSAPYCEKFTLFDSPADFAASQNPGFVLLDAPSRTVRVRLDGMVIDCSLRDEQPPLPSAVQELLETLWIEYPYLVCNYGG